MQKTIFIKAEFRPEIKRVKVKVPTGEMKTGLFGREKPGTKKEYKDEPTGNLNLGQVDGDKMADNLHAEIEKLNSDGFSVQSITPITSGTYEYKFQAQGVSSSKRVGILLSFGFKALLFLEFFFELSFSHFKSSNSSIRTLRTPCGRTTHL